MSEHADLELIAAFREGLLDPAAGDRVRRHLSRCNACAGRNTALGDVTARLAQAPPPPLPPALAQRLEAVLAAEVAATRRVAVDAAEIGAAAAVAAGEGREQRTAHRHRAERLRAGREPDGRGEAGHGRAARRSAGRARPASERRRRGLLGNATRPLAIAASVCLLAGGGFLLVHSLRPTPASEKTAAAAKGRSGAGAAASPTRTMYAAPGAGAVAVVVHSGTSYQHARLSAQAAAVASQNAGKIPSPGKAGDITMQPESFPLSACLQRVTGNGRGLIVDMATYDGRRVQVIIAPASGGTGGHVWVVGLGCSAANPDIIASASL